MDSLKVDELYYELILSDDISFENPPIIEENFEHFSIHLKDGNLIIKMKTEFNDVNQAKKVVEPFLKMWEFTSMVRYNNMDIRFQFIKSKFIDKRPYNINTNSICLETGEYFLVGENLSLSVIRKNYPYPIRGLIYSPDVEALCNRYIGYMNGRESLLSMAYFCFTLFTNEFRNEKNKLMKIEEKYKLDKKILSRISKLSSTAGNLNEARKIDVNSDLTPIPQVDKTWLSSAIELLIIRKAEVDNNPDKKLKGITCDNLEEIRSSYLLSH